ncbi:V-type proton ATPase subunit F-like [Gossypium australe]|uniref:V-type proton ATPase subunit F-like n=1 Tax=Gossypium australe TaxID=47621 RepID=A0A5B6X392_9ROSI|nr:V-type proton ATPase subunit F-like [Gossypium australe]
MILSWGLADNTASTFKSSSMANTAHIPTSNSALIAMIADEETVVGFLLAGVGNVDLRRKTNYLIVDSKTTVKQIEDAFKEFTTRTDIAIVLISQYVANMIRFLVDSYNKPIPAILEIPSKNHPYDPAHDSILSRVKHLFNAESVASTRH